MCVGMFMAILDIQIVATSLPAIRDALNISPDRMSWIQTSYLIAEVIAIPLTGLLSRALSGRRLFLGALTLFTLASIGCAFSPDFTTLIFFRILQGLAGGCLIPLVFSAVFLMFPVSQQGIATTIAGVLAVLAPTLGPTVGGYITQTYSWPWLFLVNVLPGIASVAIAAVLLPRASGDLRLLRRMDWLGLAALALGLAFLEISLKEAPERGWTSLLILCLLATVIVSLAGFVVRSLRRDLPIADLGLFRDRNFAIACALSFIFGMGLFGSVYLMPVFLALVRGHGPLDIGLVMLVTGVAQLLAAPVAVQLEQRVDARLLTAGGFSVFCSRSRLELFPDGGDGFRRHVLAAGLARVRHHVLSAAADPYCTGTACREQGAGRQRPVQSDAKPWRCHRCRAHRYSDLAAGGDAFERHRYEAGRTGPGRSGIC